MKKFKELMAKAEAIKALAVAESRDMTPEESASVLALIDQAKAAQRDEEASAALDAMQPKRQTSPAASIEVGADLIQKDPKKGFKHMRHFLAAVADKAMGKKSAEGLKFLAAAGSDEQSGLSGSTGLFLVPEAFAPMFKIQPEDAGLLGRTTNVPMNAPTLRIPALVDKNHSTSVSGGLTFSRRAETTEIPASKQAYERITLQATSLTGATFATDELMQDSPESVAAIIANGFASQYVYHRDGELVNGTGVGEPLGILNSAATVSIAKETSQTAATINLNNVLKMRAAFYGRMGVWIMNADCWSQIPALASTSGMSLVWQPSSRDAIGDTLFGMPILISEHCKALGTVGDIILADMSQVYSGLYSPLSSESSMHVRFLNNEQCFKFVERSDARPMWTTYLTPKNGGSRSCFITLATRS